MKPYQRWVQVGVDCHNRAIFALKLRWVVFTRTKQIGRPRTPRFTLDDDGVRRLTDLPR